MRSKKIDQNIAIDWDDADQLRAIELMQQPNFQHLCTMQEENFIQQFALSGDLEKSYQIAFGDACNGLSGKEIRSKAVYLVGTERGDERFQWMKKLMSAKMNVTTERIMSELASIAFSDPRDFFIPGTRRMKDVHALPDHAAACVSEIKSGTTRDGDFVELKLHNKMQALSKLSDIKNLDEKNKNAGAVNIRLSLDSNRSTEAVTNNIQINNGNDKKGIDYDG